MNYDELIERLKNKEKITEEEWEYIYNHLNEKLKNQEEISEWEIRNIIYYGDFHVETVYGEPIKHGWFDATLIFSIDGETCYSFCGYYHDDYGFEDIYSQVCPRVEKRKVVIEQWVEVD